MGPALGAGGGPPSSLVHAPLVFNTRIVLAAAWAGRCLSSLGSSGSQPCLSIRITEGLLNPPNTPLPPPASMPGDAQLAWCGAGHQDSVRLLAESNVRSTAWKQKGGAHPQDRALLFWGRVFSNWAGG